VSEKRDWIYNSCLD